MVKVNRIRFGKNSVDVLSPLENDVIGILWKECRGMRVREIHSRIKKKVALTSVAVMLDRLYDKKIVSRKAETGRGGSHYIYFTECSRCDFEEEIVEKTIDRLIEKFGPVATKYMKKRFSKKT